MPRVGVLLVGGAVLVLSACSTGGTPSVGQPPATVTSTVSQTTVVRTTATVTATLTQTPTSTAAPQTLVVATFQDSSTYECADQAAEWCWALDLTTTGPCPAGAFVAITVFKNDGTDPVTELTATSEPVTDPLGGKVSVQLSTSGLTAEGDTLRAKVKEARCA